MKLNTITVVSLIIVLSLCITAFTGIVEKEKTVYNDELNITGIAENGVISYKGIPYAEAPVGDLRFAPTVENKNWTDSGWTGERLDCTKFGVSAIQHPGESRTGSTEISEDCLYLNVWLPENAKAGDKLPVYVWIHGGAYYNGSGAGAMYDGTEFAKDGVVTVTINYRLGVLGFLSLESTSTENFGNGNWGTLDQIMALKWVNKHIEKLGGDSDNITVGGESAGSWSTSTLLVSPLAEGLFSKIIMESGSLYSDKFIAANTGGNMEACIKMSQDFAESLGADDSPEGLQKLRTMDPLMLWEKGYFDMNFSVESPYAFWPPMDGYVVPTDPVNAVRTGNYNQADIVCGYNLNEGSLFIPSDMKESDYLAFVDRTFDGDADEVLKFMERFEDMDYSEKMRLIMNFGLISAGVKMMQDDLTKSGSNVYAYRFDYVLENIPEDSYYGSFHGSELPHAFKTLSKIFKSGITENDLRMSEYVHGLWVDFMKTGTPSEEWKEYSGDDIIFVIDDVSEMTDRGYEDIIDMFSKLLDKP